MMNKPDDFFNDYQRAAHVRNKQLMSGLYHHDAELFDMWNSYCLHGIDNIREMIRNWFDSLNGEQLEVDFSSINIRQDDKVAFAHAFVHYRALDQTGKLLRQMKNRMTVCLVKSNETWSVLHQHTSIPISTKNLQGIFE